MRKQCVPGSFSSTHVLEPGNEATAIQAVTGMIEEIHLRSVCDKKLSFTEVSFSSDSCLKVSTYTASKLCDYFFPTAQFRVTIKPCDRQALPIHIHLPFFCT